MLDTVCKGANLGFDGPPLARTLRRSCFENGTDAGIKCAGLLSFDELKKRKAIIESGALEESQQDKVPAARVRPSLVCASTCARSHAYQR